MSKTRMTQGQGATWTHELQNTNEQLRMVILIIILLNTIQKQNTLLTGTLLISA